MSDAAGKVGPPNGGGDGAARRGAPGGGAPGGGVPGGGPPGGGAPGGKERDLAPRRRADRDEPKVVVIRRDVRSVRPEDMPSRASFRLALACACAAGAIAGLWLLGHVGFRLGAAPALGVSELIAAPGDGLATGTAALLRMPQAIYRLAVHEPLLVMVGFAAIAVPAAGLAAARPQRPGGPRPSAGVAALASVGATIGIAVSAAIVAWMLSPWRDATLSPLPSDVAAIAPWADSIDRIAGLDTLALVTLILWCVLVPRLPAPTWLRVLGLVLTLCATGIGVVGTAISSSISAHAHLPRSVVHFERGVDALLLGHTQRHVALLRVVDGTAVIVLSGDEARLVVTDRTTVAGLGSTLGSGLEAGAPANAR